ncbi:G8 domain-containing protein DDB_G0286311-like [Haliotis rufescens]|uniref:G8 domain-containing protein DDB_G0286311-like n=1 Tax=Haliotis rufescens TaxID=6454 RepID=UPI00201FA252|nr:G8 domain-containing protein DDB_G0286311-like [Haliotis rufescens]
MRDQVREAMVEILQGESLQDMVKSQINTELRPLKQGYHQMKRQLHHVSRSLKDFPDETSVFHESVLKEAHVGNRENSSDVCVREKQRLRIELQKCDVYTANLKRDSERFIAFNKTNQSQVSQLKTNLAVRSSQTTKHVASTSRTPVLTTPVTTPRTPLPTAPVKTPRSPLLTTPVTTPRSPLLPTPVTTHWSPLLTTPVTTPRSPLLTTSVTTPRPQVEKSRILIAPLGSHTQHQFLQLNIHSNSPILSISI